MATTTAKPKTTKAKTTKATTTTTEDAKAAKDTAATSEAPDAEATEQAPTPVDQARQEAVRLAWRYRRQAVPLAAMGATHAIGAAASAAHGPAGAGVLLLAGAGTAAGYAYGLRPRLGRWGRAYAAVACVASMGWEVAAALAGVHNLQSLLWLGGSVLALPWWIRHSERTPDVSAEQAAAAAVEPEPEPEAPPAPDWRAVRWGTYLGGKNGALAGSKLTNISEIRFGWTAEIDLGRGEHWSKAASLCDKIASIFDLPDGRALVEPLQGSPNYMARLTVLTINPLEQVTKWTGPGLDTGTGTFPLALTADGEMLHWRLWRPGAGMCHGLIAGTTGSGKSATIDLVLSEVAKSDRLVPVIIDGSGGMSVPDWIHHVRYKAVTVEETIDLLNRLLAAMFARFEEITNEEWTDKKGRKRVGRNSIDPTPDRPGFVIVIDEAHFLLMDETHGKKIRRMVEILAQMGRKVAFGVVPATQQPSVSQLGGSSVIRDMCKSGNVVALRTGERISGGMISNVPLPEPLHTLPLEWPDGSGTHGLGYVATARAIRCRTLWVEDPYANAIDQVDVSIDTTTKNHLDATPTTGKTTTTSQATGEVIDIADLIDQVETALNNGVPADPAAIARETGLTWGQAKTALRAIND